LFSLAYQVPFKQGLEKATAILETGKAWYQFQNILSAQGGQKTLPEARYQYIESVDKNGVLANIDNRQLARLAKLAGAPNSAAAGLRLHKRVGETIECGEPLFTLYSETKGELDYALAYYAQASIFSIGANS